MEVLNNIRTVAVFPVPIVIMKALEIIDLGTRRF